MTKLKGILLTEGMHGMISQVEGLAKALDINYSHHTVETKGFWKVIPPKFTPISDSVFKKIECEDVDLIISCGRKSIIPSLFLKKNSKKKVFNIHIQNPKIKLDNFDLVVVPEHDNLDGHNVLKTKGAIHYLTSEEIEKDKEYLFSISSKLRDKNIISLIIGGPTQYYDYSDRNIQEIFSKVNYLVKENNLNLVVIPSMRTPKGTIEHAKIYFGNDHLVLDGVDKKAYLSALAISKHIVITCDSSSMISDKLPKDIESRASSNSGGKLSPLEKPKSPCWSADIKSSLNCSAASSNVRSLPILFCIDNKALYASSLDA